MEVDIAEALDRLADGDGFGFFDFRPSPRASAALAHAGASATFPDAAIGERGFLRKTALWQAAAAARDLGPLYDTLEDDVASALPEMSRLEEPSRRRTRGTARARRRATTFVETEPTRSYPHEKASHLPSGLPLRAHLPCSTSSCAPADGAAFAFRKTGGSLREATGIAVIHSSSGKT